MSEENFSNGLINCVTLQDLTRLFSLAELLEMARAGRLQAWLSDSFYEDVAENLSPDEIASWNDDELRLELCELLEIDLAELSDYDAQSIERALNKRQLKEIFIDNEPESKGGTIVTNQRELVDALRNGDKIIYLVGGVFQIPLKYGGVTYYGRENAIVEIPGRRNVDFDQAEISLNDLQIFLRHLITVKYAKSTNLIFLNGDKIANAADVKKINVYKFLRGRRAFETRENFSQRAENLRGIVVGKVILDDKNYNIDLQLFDLKIDWYSDFLTLSRSFIGKFFSCIIPAARAEQIYAKERAQLVYADFYADGDRPAIKCLYLFTADGTRFDILITDKPAPEYFAELNQSGGSGGNGYGLELMGYGWNYISNLVTTFNLEG